MFEESRRRAFWPFRPRPIEGEGFSSWFARTAWANAVTPAELYVIALPGTRMARRDLDRVAEQELISNLAKHTGVPAPDLTDRTFDCWSGRLFEADNHRRKLIWVTPAGQLQRKVSFGHQACPTCLAESDVPYLEKRWRLSFVTSCERHGVLLVDRCPNCRSPIQPLYSNTTRATVAECWNCGFDLRQSKPVQASSFPGQEDLVRSAEHGCAELGSEDAVHSLSYFRLLWTVYRLLAAGRFAYALRARVAPYVPPSSISRIKEVERLNPRCRRELLRMALNLLQDWPNRFIDVCRDVGITSRVLIKDQERSPYILWSVVREHLWQPNPDMSLGPKHRSTQALEASLGN